MPSLHNPEYQMREIERLVRRDPAKCVKDFITALNFTEALAFALVWRLARLDGLIGMVIFFGMVGATVICMMQLDDELRSLAKLYDLRQYTERIGRLVNPLPFAIVCYLLELMSESRYVPFLSDLVSLGAALTAFIGVLLYITVYCCRRYRHQP